MRLLTFQEGTPIHTHVTACGAHMSEVRGGRLVTLES